MLDSACTDWLSLFCEFAVEQIEGSVLDFASWHVFPIGMRLNKSVSVLADWLIDCVGAIFVCEFDLNLLHLNLVVREQRLVTSKIGRILIVESGWDC